MYLDRYYSTQRPLGPGTIPTGAKNVVNFNEREDVLGIGFCWGYVDYSRDLNSQEVRAYELKKLNLTWDELRNFMKGKDFSSSVSAYEISKKKNLVFIHYAQEAYGDRTYYYCEDDNTIYTDYFSIGD